MLASEAWLRLNGTQQMSFYSSFVTSVMSALLESRFLRQSEWKTLNLNSINPKFRIRGIMNHLNPIEKAIAKIPCIKKSLRQERCFKEQRFSIWIQISFLYSNIFLVNRSKKRLVINVLFGLAEGNIFCSMVSL